MIYKNYIDSIKLPKIIKIKDNLYALKFEWMKVVSTNYSIKHLIENDILKPGITVIDSSSGVFAYSLALAANYYRLKCIIVGNRTIDKTLKRKLELLNAEVVLVGDPTKSPHSSQTERVEYIMSYVEKHPNTYWMRQYYDPIHRVGYQDVAVHLIENFPDLKKFNLIGGTGSGASTSGIKIGLEKNDRECNLIAVDSFKSVNFHSENASGDLIDAIGSLIPMGNLDEQYYRTVHYIDSTLAKEYAVKLFMETGLYCGDSSGGCYLAGMFEASKNSKEPFFFICADQGYRYVNTYNRDYYALKALRPKMITEFSQIQNPWSCLVVK